MNEAGIGTLFKYMRYFAYYIIYWLKLIGKQHNSKYKKNNYFFIPLDSEILPLGIIPKDIIQKEEKAIHMNMFIVAIIAGTLETVDIIYLVFTMIV